ncbi:penicillin acylase family protein, partial [Acinetobacter baumannii]
MITARTRADAFYGMGIAVAEDRLWQMEMARRSARGQLAEVLGPSAVKSDTEVLRRAYTDDELAEMVAALDTASR